MMEHGADVNIINNLGVTALELTQSLEKRSLLMEYQTSMSYYVLK
jgi:hypothetical protein